MACALAPVLCYLVIQPFAEIGIIDDWSYIKSAQVLAQTGHIVYNGWATAMLGWQLYIGALFIKIFGFSFTAVRFAAVVASMATAFLCQRSFVRAGVNTWNATLATLTFILSPLCFPLEFTFLTDIFGTLSIVVCLYLCLRALKAKSERSAIALVGIAALLNAAGGTARQIAWLGVLVMVPSTLWLLRHHRRVLAVGCLFCIAGAGVVAASMVWFDRQPYSVPEPLMPGSVDLVSLRIAAGFALRSVGQLTVLLLPVLLMFAGTLRLWKRRMVAVLLAGCCCFAVPAIAVFLARKINVTFAFFLDDFQVVPTFDRLNAIVAQRVHLAVAPEILRMLLTGLVALGVLGLVSSFFASEHRRPAPRKELDVITWKELGFVLGPFSLAYIIFLVPRATQKFFSDRYLLPLLAILLLVLVRYYQEKVRSILPPVCVLLVAIFGGFSLAATHDMFSLYRGYVAAIAQLRSFGTPAAAILGPWEFEGWTQVETVGYINNFGIQNPRGAWAPPPSRPLPANCDTSSSYFLDWTPVVEPVYGIVLDPNQCGGQLVFPAIMYATWVAPNTNSIYTVRIPAAARNRNE